MKKAKEPDVKFLREILHYNPDTGELTWNKRKAEPFKTERDCTAWNTRYANKPAFTAVGGSGYKMGSVRGKMMYAHRAIWALSFSEWPDEMIDHINSNKLDNRLQNLRLASCLQNAQNCSPKRNCASRFKGVNLSYNKDKWRADIKSGGKLKCLGVFETEKEAALAYDRAAKSLYGTFAWTNF